MGIREAKARIRNIRLWESGEGNEISTPFTMA
jgi:hypothetical protein